MSPAVRGRFRPPPLPCAAVSGRRRCRFRPPPLPVPAAAAAGSGRRRCRARPVPAAAAAGSTQDFDKQELLECIFPLIKVDKDGVPDSHGSCLYVRPVLIGNEVGIAVGAASVGPFISASVSEEYKG
ncbi:hypothetical protein ACRRTK_004239 [Alexandromys fortis]